jgi:CheY-like chemotaxis protein
MGVAYVLCDDMMFTSRITGTGRALGVEVKSARSVERLTEFLRTEAPSCLIIDLANPGLQIKEFIEQLRQDFPKPPYVVAFGAHVDATTLHAARAAGCDVVLPRSKFSEELPKSLATWLAN